MERPAWRQPEFWTAAAAVLVLTVGHYTAPVHDPFWHDLFRRLYYLPIIIAGFRYGLAGGLATSGAVSAFFLPHVLMTRAMLPRQASEAVFEIPLYIAVGVVTGVLSDRQRRASESLREAERLKTLGEMAAGMAHEVKNPLAAIRSSAQILAGRVPEKDAELAGIVISEVDRLNRLVNDFLQYARPAPLARKPVRLSSIVDSCVELLAPVAAEKHVTVNPDHGSDEGVVSVDPDQLRQVVLNLLLNAIQAVKTGGSVSVNLARAGGRTTVVVRDNGPGLSDEARKRLFEPFFTSKAGGTGLGLAIAQRIVTAHGGTLALESEPGKGTTATVTLP